MAKKVDALSKKLQELSKTVNAFKSEAVQLKIIDKLMSELSDSPAQASVVARKVSSAKPKAAKAPKAKKIAIVAQPKTEVVAKKPAAKKPAKPGIAAKVAAKKPKKIAKPVAKAAKTKVAQPVKTVAAAKVSKTAKAKKVVAKKVVAKKVVKKAAKPAKAKKPAKPGIAKAAKENGPTSTINLLFSTGYFATKRNMGEIVKHINDDLKLPYKITALSGLVNKLVKDKKLKREINAENKKYEYLNA